MSRTINLIANNEQTELKRVLPRYPMTYLTFKDASFDQALEVVDISAKGMQLHIKYGEIPFKKSQGISGELHWHGRSLKLKASVVWTTKSRVGVEFTMNDGDQSVIEFFAWSKVKEYLKPIHNMDYPYDLPAKLKYWLRADGPHEIFVWQFGSGELESFSIIIRESIISWDQNQGVKTGRVISKRGVDLPLSTEDEFIFLMDSLCNESLVREAHAFTQVLDEVHLPEMMRDFLKRKLSV